MRALIGGRWAVSLRGYLIAAPISMVWIFTTVPEAFLTEEGWLDGIIVGITSYLVAGAVLWAASATVLRRRHIRPVPITIVVLVGALAWGARSAFIGWFIDVAGLPSQTSITMRTIAGAIAGAVLIPSIAWLLANIESFRRSRRELLGALVNSEIRAEHAQTYLDVMREGVIAEVQTQVTREFSDVPANPTDPGFVQAVDDLSVRMAKDLPRTLWREAEEESELRAVQVLAAAGRRPLALWPLFVMMLTGVLVLARFYPLGDAVIAMGPPVIWGAVVVVAVNAWAARVRFPRVPAIPVIVGAALMATSGWVLYGTLAVVLPDAADGIAFSLLVGITFTLFSVGAGMARAVAVSHQRTRDHLRESISASEIREAALEEEERRLRRELATTLHGTVGANLTAASMRLRQAIDDGDVVWALEALHEARRMVDLELSARADVEHLDLGRLIEESAEAWAGLVTITGSIDDTVDVSPHTYRALDDVMTEGINNAVRHGRAKAVDITIQRIDDDLTVTVVDDGVSTGAPSAGLGARIFDSVAPGSWTRTSVDGRGTTLTVRIKGSARRIG